MSLLRASVKQRREAAAAFVPTVKPACQNRDMAVAREVRRNLSGNLTELARHGPDLTELVPDVARILHRAVPLDGVCLVTMDPATLLPTGEITHNGLPAQAMPRLAEIEIAGTDVNAFTTLVRTRRRAASLSQATSGDLARSVRHREVRRPSGLGDEVRAVLSTGRATWGGLTILRGADGRNFTSEEVELVGSVTGHVAEALRRSALRTTAGVSPTGDGPTDDGPVDEEAGLVLLSANNTLVHASASARGWLDVLSPGAGGGRSGEQLPTVVTAVANRTRDQIAGRVPDGAAAANARVRTPRGTVLTVRGMALAGGPEGLTAVLIGPARADEIAPLLADAYDLTAREREVAELVAAGLSTDAIAARLRISAWTAQDHLRSIFDKVGVSTRGELVARVFLGLRPTATPRILGW
jgi:DNA-binding CsgD family transcriptional regulator